MDQLAGEVLVNRNAPAYFRYARFRPRLWYGRMSYACIKEALNLLLVRARQVRIDEGKSRFAHIPEREKMTFVQGDILISWTPCALMSSM